MCNNFRLSAIFLRCQPIEDLMKIINTWVSVSMDNHKSEIRLSFKIVWVSGHSGRLDNHLFRTLGWVQSMHESPVPLAAMQEGKAKWLESMKMKTQIAILILMTFDMYDEAIPQ